MILLFRILFIATTVLLTSLYYIDISFQAVVISAIASGILALLVIIMIEYISHTFSSRILLSAIIGLIIGLILGHLLSIAYDTLEINILKKFSVLLKPLIYHIVGFSIMLFFVIKNEDIAFIDKLFAGKIEETRHAGIQDPRYKRNNRRKDSGHLRYRLYRRHTRHS